MYLSCSRRRRRSPKKRVAVLPQQTVQLPCDLPEESPQQVPAPSENFSFSDLVEKSAALQLPRNWSWAVPEEPGKRPVIIFYNAEFKEDIYCILKSTVIREDLTYVVSASGKLLNKLPFDTPLRSLQTTLQRIYCRVDSRIHCNPDAFFCKTKVPRQRQCYQSAEGKKKS